MMVAEDLALRGPAYLETLRGRRVVVVGIARSGVAAARVCHAAGAEVVVTDAKPLAALGAAARALPALGARYVPDAEAVAEVRRADLVVVSPGVPFDVPVTSAARNAGVPVIGELELGWRATEADTIAITG